MPKFILMRRLYENQKCLILSIVIPTEIIALKLMDCLRWRSKVLDEMETNNQKLPITLTSSPSKRQLDWILRTYRPTVSVANALQI